MDDSESDSEHHDRITSSNSGAGSHGAAVGSKRRPSSTSTSLAPSLTAGKAAGGPRAGPGGKPVPSHYRDSDMYGNLYDMGKRRPGGCLQRSSPPRSCATSLKAFWGRLRIAGEIQKIEISSTTTARLQSQYQRFDPLRHWCNVDYDFKFAAWYLPDQNPSRTQLERG